MPTAILYCVGRRLLPVMRKQRLTFWHYGFFYSASVM